MHGPAATVTQTYGATRVRHLGGPIGALIPQWGPLNRSAAHAFSTQRTAGASSATRDFNGTELDDFDAVKELDGAANVPVAATVELELPDEAATAALGASIASAARGGARAAASEPGITAGDVVCLSGPLGAGKSALARGLIRRAVGDESVDVPSPTFLLDLTYETRAGLVVHHIDCYRLQGADDLQSLGFDAACREDAVVVEWPQRVGWAAMPRERLDVALVVDQAAVEAMLADAGGDAAAADWSCVMRRARLRAHGRRWAAVLEDITGQSALE